MGTVISLKDRAKQTEEVSSGGILVGGPGLGKTATLLHEKEESSFEDIQEMNRKNAERLKRERAQANKSVLREYRIK